MDLHFKNILHIPIGELLEKEQIKIDNKNVKKHDLPLRYRKFF